MKLKAPGGFRRSELLISETPEVENDNKFAATA